MPTRTFQTMTATIAGRIAQDLTEADQRIPDEELRPTWLRALKLSQAAAARVAKEEDRIDADGRLTPAGKREALAKLAQGTVAELREITTRRANMEAAAHPLRANLFEIPKYQGAQGVEDRMDQREIRDSFRGKSQAEIVHAFSHAVKSGNMDVQRALVSGPLGPLVAKDISHSIMKEHAANAQPEKYQKLQAMESLNEHLKSLETHTAMWLRDLGADPDKA
jgi:hypothetical protein